MRNLLEDGFAQIEKRRFEKAEQQHKQLQQERDQLADRLQAIENEPKPKGLHLPHPIKDRKKKKEIESLREKISVREEQMKRTRERAKPMTQGQKIKYVAGALAAVMILIPSGYRVMKDRAEEKAAAYVAEVTAQAEEYAETVRAQERLEELLDKNDTKQAEPKASVETPTSLETVKNDNPQSQPDTAELSVKQEDQPAVEKQETQVEQKADAVSESKPEPKPEPITEKQEPVSETTHETKPEPAPEPKPEPEPEPAPQPKQEPVKTLPEPDPEPTVPVRSAAGSTSSGSGPYVWITETGTKYHNKNDCGKTNPAKASQVTLAEAQARGYEPCAKCFN